MPVRFFQYRSYRSASLTWAVVTKVKHNHYVLHSGRNGLALEGIQADDCSMCESGRHSLCGICTYPLGISVYLIVMQLDFFYSGFVVWGFFFLMQN